MKQTAISSKSLPCTALTTTEWLDVFRDQFRVNGELITHLTRVVQESKKEAKCTIIIYGFLHFKYKFIFSNFSTDFYDWQLSINYCTVSRETVWKNITFVVDCHLLRDDCIFLWGSNFRIDFKISEANHLNMNYDIWNIRKKEGTYAQC